MKAFARFKKQIQCMDLAYVDKLANLSDRTVDAKGMNGKDSIETVHDFLTMITNKNQHKNLDRQRNKINWRVWKTMQCCKNINLIYNE